MEALLEHMLVGTELRSRIVAFGDTGTLSTRLAERRPVEPHVVIDLDTQTLDLIEVGAESG
ncbi:MAG: hypothetical protein HKN46_01775 [Acidimicrobiia bacterium]|nr:hypothetical protein [Acidimicrobiia bacterium]